ncbi:hypothetical protein SAMN05216571_102335 [Onishia taeanensis]|uniref:Uncharacterized protein n=1 Tax=Onishia taeanensis TaxID=284577 RepID=A0A1G7PIH9_9GAMM|nr:hypothetical protein [Halomonas taeanensis]MAX31594.1 hypothetical protein [Halomonadaceae bacterium]SDF85924.1 hypothetical protein SAMN05216571_102335 [Halomonas taeanensis]|tara:strand:+ start:4052 stop:4681 length:630 start_codon:yes stop_codon:yes gene_type:complete
MPSETISFRATCLRALLYILLIAALAQGIYLEVLYLPDARLSEHGFTEYAESTLLAASVALLAYVRFGLRQLPTVSLLMMAFLGASLVREQDALLDTYVFDDAWQILVSLIVLPSLYVVIRRRAAFLAEFERYANSFSFGLFAAGFLVTYVYSRLYGRSEMWVAIMGDGYVRDIKDAAEETTELLGFTLILFAVIELTLLAKRRLAAQK